LTPSGEPILDAIAPAYIRKHVAEAVFVEYRSPFEQGRKADFDVFPQARSQLHMGAANAQYATLLSRQTRADWSLTELVRQNPSIDK
jgi:hypothetical protein